MSHRNSDRPSRRLFFLLPFFLLLSGKLAARGAAPSPTGAVVTADCFGMHIHHAGSTTPWPSVPFGEWRLWDAYVAWPNLEPQKGQWDFATLDSYVQLAQTHNVGLLLPLGLSPQWASSRPTETSIYQPGNAAPPSSATDWITYVQTVATRYKGKIHAYEIWNEPNLVGYWTGDVTQMVALVKAASQIIHGIDPQALVVSPSSTGIYGVDWLSQFLAAGGGQYVDVIGYHFYVNPQPPEAMVPLIAQVQAAMQQNGAGSKPLWNTETGWHTPDPFPSLSLAAAYLVRAYLLVLSSGVPRFYWYAWDNHGWVSIETTQSDSVTLTPAGSAYGIVYSWLVGAQLNGCQESANDTWTCQLQRGTSQEWVVWNSSGTQSIALSGMPGATTVTPLLGSLSKISGTTLQVTQVPELVVAAPATPSIRAISPH